MLFHSFTFILAFLPVTLIGYELLHQSKNNSLLIGWLILCSLFFYGWFEPRYVPLLLGSIIANYLIARTLMQAATCRKWILGGGVAMNLAFLGYYKYAGFFAEIFQRVSGSTFTLGVIILPLAISFFTFQQIAFLVQAYRKHIHGVTLLQYAGCISFFPHLIAGPIVQPRDLLPQMKHLPPKELWSRRFAVGLTFFALGLFKKVAIADAIEPYATKVFDMAHLGIDIPFFLGWGGALSFAFQIYFDFSGYSDMAIGLARMFGLHLPINFNAPYRSRSITEFWRRWHITLSDFFREYLYVPLGGSRHGTVRTLLNLMIVMLLSGLWHGAGWTFVAWGAVHGLGLCINKLWGESFGMKLRDSRIWMSISWLLTFTTLTASWVLFRAETFSDAGKIFRGMIDIQSAQWSTLLAFLPKPELALPMLFGFLLLIAFTLTVPPVHEFLRDTLSREEHGEVVQQSPLGKFLRWKPTALYGIALALLIIVTVYQMLHSTPEPFLYFQF